MTLTCAYTYILYTYTHTYTHTIDDINMHLEGDAQTCKQHVGHVPLRYEEHTKHEVFKGDIKLKHYILYVISAQWKYSQVVILVNAGMFFAQSTQESHPPF